MTRRREFTTSPEAPLTPPLPPMEAQPVQAIPEGVEWQYEPKWDGFRCVVFKRGRDVFLQSKAKPLARYFPEVVQAVAALPCGDVVLDGELVIARDGDLSFDALLQRLHPAASRVTKLAAATPATLLVFDLLEQDGVALLDDPLVVRRARLEQLAACFDHGSVHLSPCTLDPDVANAWFAGGMSGCDGIMAKLLDAPYTAGERLGMQKVKHRRTAECVVGGFRYGSATTVVGSLLLGLYDEQSLLHHVGFTSSFGTLDRGALTHELEARRQPPGFTGRAPGGPSRWNNGQEKPWHPLRPDLVVEVEFDHASEDRFRHGTTFVRWRPDKPPQACTLAQLQATGGSALTLLE